MNKALKIFRSIKKELKHFEDLFDGYVKDLEFSEYIIETKGKMLRPAITLLAANIDGTVNDASLWAAVSVELMHNATLVHDDIVDDANKRRNRSTFRSVHGDRRAVLYGDYLFAKSLNCVVKTGHLKIVDTIATTTGEMSIGELQQMDLSGTFDTSEEAYYDVIFKKTASLFISSLLVGYYSTASDDKWEDVVRQIGYNLGLAFQIKDDLLDYDVKSQSGKKLGNDIRERKMTLPLIYAFANGSGLQVAAIKAMMAQDNISNEEMLEVVDFAYQTGGVAYTEQRLAHFIDQSRLEINKLPNADSRLAFSMLCDYLVKRDK